MTLPPPRTLALIAGIILLAIAAWAIPSCLAKQRNAASQTRVDRAQATATVESAREASATQSTVNANEVASEALGRSNERSIRDAKGSDAVVSPAAHDAGLRAICRRKVNRDREQCRLLNAR